MANNKYLDTEALRAVKTYVEGVESDLDTKINLKADKVGELPHYTASSATNVNTFLNTLPSSMRIVGRGFVLEYNNRCFLATFNIAGPDGYYSFSLVPFDASGKFMGTSIDMRNITFGDIIPYTFSNSPYWKSYEFTINKVTSISSESTDTQYPSAKCVYDEFQLKEDVSNKVTLGSSNTKEQYPNAKSVWDECQNIREVAEGKCKTFILSYLDNITTAKSYLHFYVYNSTTKKYEDKKTELMNGDYDSYAIRNSTFNSQSDSFYISLESMPGFQEPYLLLRGFAHDMTQTGLYLISVRDLQAYQMKAGDIFLVTEIDIPDRWYGGPSSKPTFYKLETSKIDLDNYVTTNTTQLISGQKTFDSDALRVNDIKNANGILFLSPHTGSNNGFDFNGTILPSRNNNYDIGSSSKHVRNLYVYGSIRKNNSLYGISLPDMTSWTSDKEIATKEDLDTKQDKIIATSADEGKVVIVDSNGNLTLSEPSGGNIDITQIPHVDLSNGLTLDQFNEIKGKCFYDENSSRVFYPCYAYVLDDYDLLYFSFAESSHNNRIQCVNIFLDGEEITVEDYSHSQGTLYKHSLSGQLLGQQEDAVYELIIFSTSDTQIIGFQSITSHSVAVKIALDTTDGELVDCMVGHTNETEITIAYLDNNNTIRTNVITLTGNLTDIVTEL